MVDADLLRRKAVREAIAEEMRRDPRVFLIGEDVALTLDTPTALRPEWTH